MFCPSSNRAFSHSVLRSCCIQAVLLSIDLFLVPNVFPFVAQRCDNQQSEFDMLTKSEQRKRLMSTLNKLKNNNHKCNKINLGRWFNLEHGLSQSDPQPCTAKGHSTWPRQQIRPRRRISHAYKFHSQHAPSHIEPSFAKDSFGIVKASPFPTRNGAESTRQTWLLVAQPLTCRREFGASARL